MNSENKKIPLFLPVNLPEMENVALEVIRSGQIAAGPLVEKFEKNFASLIHQKHIVATNDMTSALVLALKLSGVRPGDKVATQAFSCLSTNSAISIVGATPIWIDINPEVLSMCPEDLNRKIAPDIKAVLLYHIAGYPAETEKISSICRINGIKLIEDCNNALGASLNGDPVGKLGDFSVYSFYPNRQINGFEGGALICPDLETENKAKKLRRFGVDYKNFRDLRGEIDSKSDVPEVGISAAFSQLNAAVALVQFPTFEDRKIKTIKNANQLQNKLSNINEIKLIYLRKENIPAYWVLLAYAEKRDELLKELKVKNINSSILHQRNDVYTGFSSTQEKLDGTDYIMQNIIAIPCGWWLGESEINTIIKTVNDFYL